MFWIGGKDLGSEEIESKRAEIVGMVGVVVVVAAAVVGFVVEGESDNENGDCVGWVVGVGLTLTKGLGLLK